MLEPAITVIYISSKQFPIIVFYLPLIFKPGSCL